MAASLPVTIIAAPADVDFARKLQADLGARGMTANVYDDDFLPSPGPFLETIDAFKQLVARSGACLILHSRAALASEWVKQEINALAEMRAHGSSVNLLVVSLEPAASLTLPPPLAQFPLLDLTRLPYEALLGHIQSLMGATRTTGAPAPQPSPWLEEEKGEPAPAPDETSDDIMQGVGRAFERGEHGEVVMQGGDSAPPPPPAAPEPPPPPSQGVSGGWGNVLHEPDATSDDAVSWDRDYERYKAEEVETEAAAAPPAPAAPAPPAATPPPPPPPAPEPLPPVAPTPQSGPPPAPGAAPPTPPSAPPYVPPPPAPGGPPPSYPSYDAPSPYAPYEQPPYAPPAPPYPAYGAPPVGAPAGGSAGSGGSGWGGIPQPSPKREKSAPPPARELPLEQATFTAYHPKEMQPRVWQPLLVYISLDTPAALAQVSAAANERLAGRRDQFRASSGEATGLRRGSKLTIVPEIPGFRANPPEMTIAWEEDAQQHEFRVRAETARPGQAANGTVKIYMGPILRGEIPVSIFVQPSGVAANLPDNFASVVARAYRRVFASYSHRDTPIVRCCETAAQTMGDRYLRDVTLLRSGEHWDERLLDAVTEADIFQLFWSEHAAKSPAVEKEWRRALSLIPVRGQFIRPVYWSREPYALPPELAAIHFEKLDLARLGWGPARSFLYTMLGIG